MSVTHSLPRDGSSLQVTLHYGAKLIKRALTSCFQAMSRGAKTSELAFAESCSKSKGHSHNFTSEEEESIRVKLLGWYDINKRDLPWRRFASEQDTDKRGYAVWVSEVMLQQTQVSTVIDYYNRWMEKWPTLQDLAKASVDEVNEVWSGLGYYSRGRRLYEGSKKIVEELNGKMPCDARSLQQMLPGVGRYTAGAISSIAFNQATGVVDGNVIRVLSRMRLIGVDCTSKVASAKFWELANSLVDNVRPGDFNQAMMELGATVCSPKTPQCTICPFKDNCMAYKQVEELQKRKASELLLKTSKVEQAIKVTVDIEDCSLCLHTNWDYSLGVCNYPNKPKKKEAKQEIFAACLVQKKCQNSESSFVVVQRPESGLLAGLWEFPNIELEPDIVENKRRLIIIKFLSEDIGLSKLSSQKELGEIVHKFSHRHHTYKVFHFIYEETNTKHTNIQEKVKWVSKDELKEVALPTAMRKIFKLYEDSLKTSSPASKRRKVDVSIKMKAQKTVDMFFKAK